MVELTQEQIKSELAFLNSGNLSEAERKRLYDQALADRGTSGGQAFGAGDDGTIGGSISENPPGSFSNTGFGIEPAPDWRTRLRPPSKKIERYFGPKVASNPMAILHETGGLIFPYTPGLSMDQAVEYTSQGMTQVNQDSYYFSKHASLELNFSGDWTVQSMREGAYALGCIHFLRTNTKMRFGVIGENQVAGQPPPVFILDAGGSMLFNQVPVLIKSFNITFDKDVDYVRVGVGDYFNLQFPDAANADDAGNEKITQNQGEAWIPTQFQMSIGLIIQQTPKKLRTEFDLEKFRNGDLLRSGGYV